MALNVRPELGVYQYDVCELGFPVQLRTASGNQV